MRRIVGVSIVMGLAACPMGCASAHYVSKQGDTGVIAIPSNSDAWPFHYRQEALQLIQQHVGPNYEIVDEHQVVTGVKVTNNEQTQRDLTPNKRQPNMPGERETTTGTVSATNVTEWQITYRRVAGAGVPSVMPAAGTVPVPPGATGLPQVTPVGGSR
jgi:hypothetical protein